MSQLHETPMITELLIFESLLIDREMFDLQRQRAEIDQKLHRLVDHRIALLTGVSIEPIKEEL